MPPKKNIPAAQQSKLPAYNKKTYKRPEEPAPLPQDPSTIR